MSENQKNDKTKLSIFSFVLALVLIVIVLISVRAVFHNNPPATIRTLMVSLDIPAAVSVDEGMREAVQESFQSEFPALYGIDLTAAESAYFSKLLQDCAAEFEMEPFLREMIGKECNRRRIPEETVVRQIMGIRDPAEREKIRAEWIASGQAAVLRSEPFLRAMEPVNSRFFEWWTPRHPEYEGIAAGITLTDDHGSLIDQVAVVLRREVLVRTAQELQEHFVTDLRRRGKAISEEKQQRAFAVFLRFSKVRYTAELMRSIAEAIAEEAELTDDEILHCLLLKDRKLSNERLSTIHDVQVRYLTPRTLDTIPAETIDGIRKELQAITGVEYAQ